MTNANDQLSHFTGSEELKPYMMGHYLSDGALAMAQDNGAFWLLDIVVSYQHSAKFQGEEFQCWTLEKVKGYKYKVTATNGNDGAENVLCVQKIPFSDFPFDTATLWNVNKTIMLPSEY